MAVTLTAKTVASLRTDRVQEEIYDALVPGLILRVGRGGTKTWVVRYRSGGRYRRLQLGRYPVLSLADAREAARAKLAEAQAGADPAQERAARKAADTSFAALAREVLGAKAPKTREKTRRERQRILEKELLPHWAHRDAASITRREIIRLVERIAERGAPVMANRTLALVKVLFSEGLKREFPLLEANPAALIEPPGEEEARRRFLERHELRAVWEATEWENPITRGIFRLTLLTAQRVGSVMRMKWADLDDADVWRIPAADFKGRREHWVPLSKEARAVVAELRELTGAFDYVFPRGRRDGKRPHVTSVNKALQRLNAATSEIEPWTLHDFRTTFRTHATRAKRPKHRGDPAGLGVAPDVADAVLGHKDPSLGFGRYTGEPERYLLSEKRDALEAWGTFVARAVKR